MRRLRTIPCACMVISEKKGADLRTGRLTVHVRDARGLRLLALRVVLLLHEEAPEALAQVLRLDLPLQRDALAEHALAVRDLDVQQQRLE